MTAIPTPEEFVARARVLGVKMRERAAEAEQLRRMPDATVKDFLDGEFYRIMQPKRYGGCEYGWDVWCECLIELAKGSASQAWAAMVHCEYVQMVSAFSQQAQDDVWGNNPATLVSSSFQPVGKVECKEGGYTLVTVGPKWGFSSGIDEASWLIVGGVIPGRGWSFFLVPKSAVTVIDDWHVLGLKGSGSKSFTIDKEIFVPEYRTVSDQELSEGKGPGVTPDSPAIARCPRRTGPGFGIVAVPLGAAMSMLDDFKTLVKDQVSHRAKSAADQAMALRIAECAAELEAAKRVMLSTLREHMAILRSGRELTPQQRMEARRDTGFIALIAQRVAQRLLSAAGSDALYESSPLQRAFRDVHAGGNHMGVSWEIAATPYGEYAMGYQPAAGQW